MKTEKIRYTKALKFITLLLTSILIATVSAAIYNQMYMNATPISVQAFALVFKNGTDASAAGTKIEGSTVTLTKMNAPKGGTNYYDDPVRLNNTHASTTYTLNITVQDCSGSTGNLSSIIVRIYNVTNGASIGNLIVWNGTGTGSPLTNLSIAPKVEWRFRWEITWKTTAVATDTVTAKLVFDIKS